MATTVVTATDVQQAAPGGVLNVPANAVITPLARDTAAELGVTINKGGPGASPAAPTGAGGDELANRVRTIVESLLGSGGGGSTPAPTPARPPVKLATIRESTQEPFPYLDPPGMKVRTGDVITADDGSPVAAGYMSITEGSFPWTLTYDEVQVVLEGELHLGGDGGNKVGRAGDVFFVPKGSSITFGTPTWAKFVYITFPANWEDQIE